MTDALCSARAVTVEHVIISSTKPFEDVRAKLATLAPRIDDGICDTVKARARFESWRPVRRSPFSANATTERC